jgi:hypothetical protein
MLASSALMSISGCLLSVGAFHLSFGVGFSL